MTPTGSVLLSANPGASNTSIATDISGTRPVRVMGIPVGAGAMNGGSAQVQISPNGTDWIDVGDPILAANNANAQLFDAAIKYIRVTTNGAYARTGVVNFWAFC